LSPPTSLPLASWKPTRDRLHGWARLAGAVRRQACPHRKHWWHISLLPTARGLTTGPFPAGDGSAEIELLLRRGELQLATSGGEDRRLSLAADPGGDGREALASALASIGVQAELPAAAATAGDYDADAAGRYLDALAAVVCAFQRWQGDLHGETSPIHLWPHHFDLALSGFSGRVVPGMESAEPEHRDESVTVGFSTGDDGDPEPYLYAIAHPWPAGLVMEPLPAGRWHGGNWKGGFLPWAEVAASDDPGATVLAFCRAASQAFMIAQAAVERRPPAEM
jgi:hypothetical protein